MQRLIDFDQPPSVRSSATSIAAAESIKPSAARLRQQVLEHIRECGGCSDEQGMEATGLQPNTYRPRRCELVDCGQVIDSGRKALTRSGRSAVVWIATTPSAHQ